MSGCQATKQPSNMPNSNLVGDATLNWFKVADGERESLLFIVIYVELTLRLRDIWIATWWRGTECCREIATPARSPCMRKPSKATKFQVADGRCEGEGEKSNEWSTQALFEYYSSRMSRHSFLFRLTNYFHRMSFLLWLFFVSSHHPDVMVVVEVILWETITALWAIMELMTSNLE